MAETLGKLIVQVLMDAADYKEEAGKVEARTRTMGANLDGLAKSITGALTTAFKAAAAAAAGLATASAVVGASFEQAMSKVAANQGISKVSEDFRLLTEEARRLGATTSYSATDAARGMDALASAGFTTSEILSTTGGVLKLAAAGAIELEDAAALSAATLRQFGLDASEITRVTDVLTVATQASQFSMRDIGDAMKYAGALGSALGMSLEETTAAVAQFRDIGLEASQAGTAFRMMMSMAARPSEEATAALEAFGLTAQDINPELNSFAQIVQKIGDSGMSTTAIMRIFGSEVGGAVAKLALSADESVARYDALLDRLQSAAGATEQTYGLMTDNVMGAFNELRSAAEEVLLGLFDTYAGPLRELLTAMSEFVRKIGVQLGVLSGEVSSGMADAIGSLAALIRLNGDEWATRIALLIRDVTTFAGLITAHVIPGLAAIIPYLDEIAILMATVWAAIKVNAFVAALATAIPVITSMTFSLSGMGAALATATGGLSALAAAIAVLVAGLAVLITRTRDTSAELDRLRAKQQETEAIRQRAIAGGAEERLIATKEALISAMEDEVAAGREVSEVLAAEADAILGMSAATASMMLQRGELLHMNGQLVTTERAFALYGQDAVAAMQMQIERSDNFADAKLHLRGVLAQYQSQQQRTTGAIDEGALATQRAADALARLSSAGEEAVDVVEDQEDAERSLEEVRDDAYRREQEREEDAARKAQAFADMRATLKARQYEEERRLAEEAARVEAELAAETEEWRRGRLRRFVLDVGDALRTIGSIASGVGRAIGSVVAGLGNALEAVTGIRFSLSEALDAVEGASVFDRAPGSGPTGVGPRQTATEQAAADYAAALVDGGMSFLEQLVVGMPAVIDALVREAPRLFEGIAANIGPLIQALLDAIPGIVEALAANLGPVVKSLTEALFDVAVFIRDVVPGLVIDLLSALPDIIAGLLDAVPVIIETLLAAVPRIVVGIVEAVPVLIETILTRIPDIVTALIEGVIQAIPAIVVAVIRAVPQVIRAVILAIPEIVGAVVRAIPTIITTLIAMIPEVILAFAEQLPTILPALVALIPRLYIEIIAALPQIVVALIDGIIREIILRMPEIAFEMAKGFAKALKDAFLAIVDAIKEFFQRILPFGSNGQVRQDRTGVAGVAQDIGIAIGNLFRSEENDVSVERAAGGIPFVPRVMRVTLHPGEEVLPADRRRPVIDGPDQPLAGAAPMVGGGRGGGSIRVEIPVRVDGREIDRALVDVDRNGSGEWRAVVRRTAGVLPGIDRRGFSNRGR